ncbi:malonate decarboxylase holo-ACP synthase [Pseudomonas segetis]
MNDRLDQTRQQHYQAHDLLWGFAPEHLPLNAPAWVVEALQVEPPVVVRRAQGTAGTIAVGVRGKTRDQRFACWMPRSAVSHSVQPEQLIEPGLAQAHRDWPLFKALALLAEPLDQSGLRWGVTGSLGFQLASGIEVIHPASDLDLLLRTPQPISREQAKAWLELIAQAPARVDVQLQCPAGAVALAEWATSRSLVLLKTQVEPLLVDDPWAVEHVAP